MLVHYKEHADLSERSQTLEELQAWATSIGIVISPKIRYPHVFHPGYLGTVALEPLLPGEVLILAPNKSMLTSNLSNIPELQQMYNDHPEFFSIPDRDHEDYRMLSFLLYEISKGRESSWYYYFASLPKSIETITEWKEKELLELQDSDFVKDILIRKNWNSECCKELSTVYKKYPELIKKEFTEVEKVQWCWLVMTTRCFGGGLPYPSLIPVADFLNHSNGPTLYYYGEETNDPPDALDIGEVDADEKLIDDADCVEISFEQLHHTKFESGDFGEEILNKSDWILKKAKKLDGKGINSK